MVVEMGTISNLEHSRFRGDFRGSPNFTQVDVVLAMPRLNMGTLFFT